MTGLDFSVHSYVDARDRTVPDIVVSLSPTHKITAVLLQQITHLLFNSAMCKYPLVSFGQEG